MHITRKESLPYYQGISTSHTSSTVLYHSPVERGPKRKPKIKPLPKEKAEYKIIQTKDKEKPEYKLSILTVSIF